MNATEKAARHVAPTAGTATDTFHMQLYRNRSTASIVKLGQAADIVCLLSFFPLSATTRQGLLGLLDRRLRRSYGGAGDE